MKNKRNLIILSIIAVAFIGFIGGSRWRVKNDKEQLRKCFLGRLDISDLSEDPLIRYEPALIALLNDINITVKVSSIQLLGNIKSTNSRKHLVRLLDSNSDQVIFFTIEALGLIGEPFPEDKIIDIFRMTSSRQIRSQAIISLVRSGGVVTQKYFESVYSSNDPSVEDEIYASIILYALTREQKYYDQLALLLQDQDIESGVKMCSILVLRQIDIDSLKDLYDKKIKRAK